MDKISQLRAELDLEISEKSSEIKKFRSGIQQHQTILSKSQLEQLTQLCREWKFELAVTVEQVENALLFQKAANDLSQKSVSNAHAKKHAEHLIKAVDKLLELLIHPDGPDNSYIHSRTALLLDDKFKYSDIDDVEFTKKLLVLKYSYKLLQDEIPRYKQKTSRPTILVRDLTLIFRNNSKRLSYNRSSHFYRFVTVCLENIYPRDDYKPLIVEAFKLYDCGG